MPPIEAYDPWVTGGLLYFAIVWFRISVSLDSAVSLAEAVNLIITYPIQVVAKPFEDTVELVVMIILFSPVWLMVAGIILDAAYFAARAFNLFPNAPSRIATALYTLSIPFDFLADVLIAIPIEVAVVIAVIAFLDIVVGSDRYATS